MDYLKSTKKELIGTAKSDAYLKCEDGVIDPLNEYLKVKSKIDYLTEYLKGLHDYAVTEFESHTEKEVCIKGRKISLRETGAKYDFSKCNYPNMDELEYKMSKTKSEIDLIKKTLKTFTKKTVIVDDESGETFEVNPPIKTSKTSLIISY